MRYFHGGLSARLVVRRYHVIGAFFGALLFGHVALFSRAGEALSAAEHPPRRVALTFDDGPHPGATERILQILKEKRVPATFFVVGKQVERYPGLLRSLDRAGHEIANHTYDHPNLTTISALDVKFQLDDTRRLIEKIIDKKCAYFRPPGGQLNASVAAQAARGGHRLILWDVFPQDHLSPAPNALHARVMAAAHDGAVVLLHSGIESTMQALPGLIDDLRGQGYTFLTISDMLNENLDPAVTTAWAPAPATPLAARPAASHRS